MLAEDVKEALMREEESDLHKALRKLVMDQHSRSASTMCGYHGQWDKHSDTVAGSVTADKVDQQAAKRKEPQKMVVPTARAQVHTLVSFLFLYFQQNQYAFEYSPQDAQDYKIREVVEKLVDRDCRKSKWPLVLYQFLLDAARFNLGVIEHTWVTEKSWFPQTTMNESSFMGASYTSTTEEMVETTTFQGNRIYSVSPYRFFPDPSVPLTRMQDGEFVGIEEEMSKTSLKKLQAEGVVAGVEHIRDFQTESWGAHGRSGKRNRYIKQPTTRNTDAQSDMVAVLRQQVKIIPKDFLVDGEPLGTEDYPVTWIVWVANDHRVIRAEPANYLHGEFTVSVGQFDSDIHEFVGQGLAGIVDKLQETISWFINSHILSVRRNLDHQLLFDPKYIDPAKLQSRAPMIPLRKSVERQRISDKVFQLQTTDVTGAHMANAQQLIELMFLVTGVNENATGSVGKGRRSATERGAANQGAGGRLRTIGACIFAQGLAPLSGALNINLRQGLERASFDRGVGAPDPTDPEAMALHEEQWALFKADPAHLAAGADFFVLDSTDPNQKMYMAQALSDLFKVVMTTPDAAAAFDIDASSVFKEIMQLRGSGDLNRHSLRARLKRQQTQQQLQPQPVNTLGNEQPGNPNAGGQG
tara:strand:- start:2271 stop:4187 length:1917 start_codon:yes stop_codon:yes gene_type:complete